MEGGGERKEGVKGRRAFFLKSAPQKGLFELYIVKNCISGWGLIRG